MSEAGTQIPEQAVQKVDVLIMAGGSASALGSDVPCEGVFPINGKPMVEYIVDALRASGVVDRIFVTAPTSEGLGDWVSKIDGLVVTDGNFVENGLAGCKAIIGDDPNYKRPILG